MKYSKATNYALHVVLELCSQEDTIAKSVEELASLQNVSPSYLSKILTRLTKENILIASSGAKGGYSLKTPCDSLSFLDIIHAIEGDQSLFSCTPTHGENCLIYQTMMQSELEMETYLANQKIKALANRMKNRLKPDHID